MTHAVVRDSRRAAVAPAGRDQRDHVQPAGRHGRRVRRAVQPVADGAVDISGWRLDGVALTVPAGTVILPGGLRLFVQERRRSSARSTAAASSSPPSTPGRWTTWASRWCCATRTAAWSARWPTRRGPVARRPRGRRLLAGVDRRLAGRSARSSNWAASGSVGGTPGAANSVQGTVRPFPRCSSTRCCRTTPAINQDEMGEYDPWIEIYNASSGTIDLGGMYLSDDFGVPTKWPFPRHRALRRVLDDRLGRRRDRRGPAAHQLRPEPGGRLGRPVRRRRTGRSTTSTTARWRPMPRSAASPTARAICASSPSSRRRRPTTCRRCR